MFDENEVEVAPPLQSKPAPVGAAQWDHAVQQQIMLLRGAGMEATPLTQSTQPVLPWIGAFSRRHEVGEGRSIPGGGAAPAIAWRSPLQSCGGAVL